MSVNAPVPNGWPTVSLVVAVSPPDNDEFVPHANPRTVTFDPPVAVMLPLRVAVVAVTLEADCVVTVGTDVIEFTVNVPDVVNV